jgi:3-oxoacyl-[acyl-carrier-protein] synthase III
VTTKTSVGVLGIGVHLPEDIRTNDWWPEHVVAKWRRTRSEVLVEGVPESCGDSARRVIEASAALRDDPFQGCSSRRIASDETVASDMELEAARLALEESRIQPDQIDLLLCDSSVPDRLVTNNACLLHHRLALPAKCFTLATTAMCNAFQLQLSIAEQMIRSGQARHALLVQSSLVSRLLSMEQPHSPWFGDGAAAVVVGPVPAGLGVVGRAHRTNGAQNAMVVAGVPNGRWYEDGRILLYSAAPKVAQEAFLEIPTDAKTVVTEALAQAGARPSDVRFYAPHQATPWLRCVTQDHLGLLSARSIETYAWAGNILGAGIPLALSLAEREGLIGSGDLVVLFAGGAGVTYSSTVLRWGV